MGLTFELAGWGAFGLAARAYQLGIQHRSFKSWMPGYALSAGLWMGIGYFVHNMIKREDELIELRVKTLSAHREARRAAAAAAAGTAESH